MLGILVRRAMHVALVVAFGASSLHGSESYDSTIADAIRLLPKRPAQVVVIDADDAKPDVRQTLIKLDAFITKGSKVVYLTKHSEMLQGAHRGSRIHQYMLASIIWHEMAHLDGAGEAEAQQREENLWTRFLLDGRVDQMTALRYLALLSRRHAS